MNKEQKGQVNAFLEKYKVLESFESDNPKLFNYYKMQNNSLFECLRHTRNLLTHNIINNEYPVFINKLLNDELEKIIVKMKEKIFNKAIKMKDMFTITLNSKLADTLKIMEEKNYTYVPVLNKDEKLIGVLTENTLLAYIVKNSMCFLIDENTEIIELEDLIPISKNRNEGFEFVSKNTNIIEVEKKFNDTFADGKRLSVIYITQNGLSSEKILGMVTAWDIIGKK